MLIITIGEGHKLGRLLDAWSSQYPLNLPARKRGQVGVTSQDLTPMEPCGACQLSVHAWGQCSLGFGWRVAIYLAAQRAPDSCGRTDELKLRERPG